MTRINVRCCCDPSKVLGTLPVSSSQLDRSVMPVLRIPQLAEEKSEKPARLTPELLSIKRAAVSPPMGSGLPFFEYAVCSDNRQIEFFRGIQGFVEGDETDAHRAPWYPSS